MENSKGQRLFVDKISKETWRVNTQIDDQINDHIIVKYQIYSEDKKSVTFFVIYCFLVGIIIK